jgi:hypothetical protein
VQSGACQLSHKVRGEERVGSTLTPALSQREREGSRR